MLPFFFLAILIYYIIIYNIGIIREFKSKNITFENLHFEGFKKVLLQSKSRKEAQIMLMEHVDDLVLTNFLLKGVSFLDGKPKLKFNIHAIQNNIQNMLAAPEKSINFNGPTYFLHGSKSEYIQNKDIESINQLFPCNQVIKINNAGHWIHFDQKQQFINCIKDIFKNK